MPTPADIAKRHCLIASLVLFSASSACGVPRDGPVVESDSAPNGARAALLQSSGPLPSGTTTTARVPFEQLSFSLLDRLSRTAPASNIIISPTSAGLALSLALEGAAGTTWDSLATVLGVAALDPRVIGLHNATLVTAMRRTPGVTLVIANALWGRSGLQFNDDFVSRLHDEYEADVAALDLQAPPTIVHLNAWAAEKTGGKIPMILAEAPPADMAMVLTNAVYFKGKWASGFDRANTTPRRFHLEGGSFVQRAMMEQTAAFGYAADDDFALVRLPYQGEQIAMYVLLPSLHSPAASSQGLVTPERFRRAIAAIAPRTIALVLPRFTTACTVDLSSSISSLGAQIAFDKTRADFSRMFTGEPRRVWIGKVVQKTLVDVNEEGTEAAAVSAVGMIADSASAPIALPFVVDRPFLFAIRDDRTGALLFLGRISNPAGSCGAGT